MLKYVTVFLSGCECMRHFISHRLVAVSSVCSLSVRLSNVLERASWVTSSAYCNVKESRCVGSGSLLVYILKRVGDMTDPCGIPAWGVKYVEKVEACLILVRLSVRKLQRSRLKIGGKSKSLQILYFSPVCHTVSKACFTSLVTKAVLK